MLEAVEQALALGLLDPAHDRRIGRDEVARRDGVHVLTGVKVDLLLVARVEALDLADQALHPARGQQVGLLDIVEGELFLPGLVLEAPVAPLGRRHRLGLAADQALRRALPQLERVLPELRLGLRQLPGILQQFGGHPHEGLTDTSEVHDGVGVLVLLAIEEGLHHPLALLAQLLPLGDQGLGVRLGGALGRRLGHGRSLLRVHAC